MNKIALAIAGSTVLGLANGDVYNPIVTLRRGELAPNDPALLFEMFKAEHNKSYDSDEEHRHRYGVFVSNLMFVAEHNAKSLSERTWEAGLNHLADLTHTEFKRDVLMDEQNCDATDRGVRKPFKDLISPKAGDLPHPLPPWMDWRDYGIITPVKNQGMCGSCWTFSTTGALEAHLALKKLKENNNRLEGPVTQLSEQQLIDCSWAFGNQGCDGGLPSHAYEYIRYGGGLETEEQYPYQDGGNSTDHARRVCQANPALSAATVPYGSFNLTYRNEIEIQEVIATTGPVSIAFDVQDDFRFYKSGVYSNTTCQKDVHSINHAVLGVGYGVDAESGKPYWIIKNSWGANWGEEGYFRIERNNNMCGLADCVSFPNLYSADLEENAEHTLTTTTESPFPWDSNDETRDSKDRVSHFDESTLWSRGKNRKSTAEKRVYDYTREDEAVNEMEGDSLIDGINVFVQ